RRTAQAAHHQRQPPEADRERQRNVGRGSKSPAEAVRADAENVEVAGRHGRTGGRRQEGAAPRDADDAAALGAPGCGAEPPRKEVNMVTIRLRRAGSKKRPFFRVVVTDSRTARDSSFVEILGHYNPRSKPAVVQVDKERVSYWLSKGAQPSDSVRTLIARHLTPPPAPVAAAAAPAEAEAK